MVLCGRSDGGSQEELLRLALYRYCGLTSLPPIARQDRGKPWFPDEPSLQFSLSNSGPLILCAVGDVPLGVDIERFRPHRAGLPRHVLSDREFDWYTRRGSRQEDFLALWTLKESRCKCTGRGLDRSPALLAVPLAEPGGWAEQDGFSFRSYGGGAWQAALCAQAPAELPADIFWLRSQYRERTAAPGAGG